jgi:hypothetical protein
MSALPPKADIERDVRFVPEAKVGNSKGVMAVATSRWTMKLARRVFSLGCRKNFSMSENPSAHYERHGTLLCAHALNPTMHRTRAANTATFNTASIMLPSTESRLPFEVLIFRRPEIFSVVAQMDWMEKDFPAVRSASKRSASIAPQNQTPSINPGQEMRNSS